MGRDFGQSFLVFRLTRLLKEREVQRFEQFPDPDRQIGIVSSMTVEHQQRIGSDGLPDRLRGLPDFPEIDRIVQRPDRKGKTEFECIVARRHRNLRFLPDDDRIQ